MSSAANVCLEKLLVKAVNNDNGSCWEAVDTKMEALLSKSENDESLDGFFDAFERYVVPPKILESLIRVMRLSKNHGLSRWGPSQPPILQKICKEFGRFSFEHVRVACEGSTEEEVLELDQYGGGERYERNESPLMLLVNAKYVTITPERLKSAHFLATQYPALLHVESYGGTAGEHFKGTAHPMKAFPKLVEKVAKSTAEDEVVIGYIRDYWFPVHATWCDELGVGGCTVDRFLRMLFDIVVAEASHLLRLICKWKMWEVATEEEPRLWKGVLSSGILGENDAVLEHVIPMLEVTPECLAFAQQKNRSTKVINALIKSNPSACTVEGDEPTQKRAKTAA